MKTFILAEPDHKFAAPPQPPTLKPPPDAEIMRHKNLCAELMRKPPPPAPPANRLMLTPMQLARLTRDWRVLVSVLDYQDNDWFEGYTNSDGDAIWSKIVFSRVYDLLRELGFGDPGEIIAQFKRRDGSRWQPCATKRNYGLKPKRAKQDSQLDFTIFE
jgi:hypothetical protein